MAYLDFIGINIEVEILTISTVGVDKEIIHMYFNNAEYKVCLCFL